MRKLSFIAAAVTLLSTFGCVVHQANAPSESGPAELGLSLKLFAVPDRIAQDGLHPSSVSITAFDAGGHPLVEQVHLDVVPSGFGTLSTNANGDVTTSTDPAHPTVVQYMPPSSTCGANTTVTILASTVGPNAGTGSLNQVAIVAQPAASIASTAPVAVITMTPDVTTVATQETLTFDATASCAGGLSGGVCSSASAFTKFIWNFGDNSGTFSGGIIGHAYNAVGNYSVTLTASNDRNQQAIACKALTVIAVAAPTAAFTVSPTPVVHGATTNFNATTSTAAAGHTLARFDWNFGDGTSDSSASPTDTHIFAAAGVYSVTLTVTDDVGQTKTVTVQVTVT